MFKHLASNPDNSNGRLYNELDDDLRNPFERDRARVIPVSYTHLTLPTTPYV